MAQWFMIVCSRLISESGLNLTRIFHTDSAACTAQESMDEKARAVLATTAYYTICQGDKISATNVGVVREPPNIAPPPFNRHEISGLGFEPVAHIADGFDEDRIGGIAFDFIAQSIDAAVNAARSDKNIAAPDAPENFITRKRASGAFDKQRQQTEFLGRQFDFISFPEQLP